MPVGLWALRTGGLPATLPCFPPTFNLGPGQGFRKGEILARRYQFVKPALLVHRTQANSIRPRARAFGVRRLGGTSRQRWPITLQGSPSRAPSNERRAGHVARATLGPNPRRRRSLRGNAVAAVIMRTSSLPCAELLECPGGEAGDLGLLRYGGVDERSALQDSAEQLQLACRENDRRELALLLNPQDGSSRRSGRGR